MPRKHHRRGSPAFVTRFANDEQAIGAAKDAARMDRVVNFYARLPRGPAPAPKPTGLLERYGERYFGKNPSAARE